MTSYQQYFLNNIVKDIQSPCVKVCVLDDDSRCKGCFRTKKEISDWYSYTNIEKLEILENVKKRKKFGN